MTENFRRMYGVGLSNEEIVERLGPEGQKKASEFVRQGVEGIFPRGKDEADPCVVPRIVTVGSRMKVGKCYQTFDGTCWIVTEETEDGKFVAFTAKPAKEGHSHTISWERRDAEDLVVKGGVAVWEVPRVRFYEAQVGRFTRRLQEDEKMTALGFYLRDSLYEAVWVGHDSDYPIVVEQAFRPSPVWGRPWLIRRAMKKPPTFWGATWKITEREYRQAVGEVPSSIHSRVSKGETMEVGKYYRAGSVCWYVRSQIGDSVFVEKTEASASGRRKVERVWVPQAALIVGDPVADVDRAVWPDWQPVWRITEGEYFASIEWLREGERFEVGKFYADRVGNYWAPIWQTSGEDGQIVFQHAYLACGAERPWLKGSPRNARMSMLTAKPEQLGTYSGEQLFEISLGQYRDVVGELPPTPLRVGDAMEIGKCYATLEGCYFAPFMQDGQAFIEKIRIFELGDPDRICLKLSESQGELRVVEGQTIWEIPRGQYPGRAAWGEPVEAKKPVECSEKRPLAPGALLEVGKFYRDSSGAYMAVLRKQGPYRIVSVPQVATESGWRKVHRENLVALGPPEGHTWEISQKEYEERVARGREGFCEAPTSGEPVTCPECGDVVCGKNRLVEVQDGDEMLFVGCLPCLDRCVEGHPLLAFLAREWLAREEPK